MKEKLKSRTVDSAAHYFNCSDSERAVFEAGIKLGTIYHQFIGAPVNRKNVSALEKAIEKGSLVQPFVKKVRVRIDRKSVTAKRGVYTYKTLTGNMLTVTLTIRYKDVEATCEMRHVPEINYPLMFLRKIEIIRKTNARKRKCKWNRGG